MCDNVEECKKHVVDFRGTSKPNIHVEYQRVAEERSTIIVIVNTPVRFAEKGAPIPVPEMGLKVTCFDNGKMEINKDGPVKLVEGEPLV